MSKTLKLIDKYMRLLKEQDDPNAPVDPNAGMEAPPIEALPAEEPAPLPLSTTAEYRYMEDVIAAANMPRPNGEDAIAFENLQDLLKRPDVPQLINGQKMTAKDFYQKKILPLIRPAQEAEQIKNLSNDLNK